ncbi:hypothetical protein Tco_1304016 [Tanacetum coccineum]
MACDPSWKTDGGFRSNYLCEVHRRILIKMPTFSKLVSPHIESKVKWLNSKFHVINDMLKYSGCQWNDVEKKVACEKDWYDGYYKTHKEGKAMLDFKFPFFNELELVYGKDRATNVGEYFVILSDGKRDDAQTVPSASNTSNARNMGGKQKIKVTGDKVAKKRKTSSSQDVEARL